MDESPDPYVLDPAHAPTPFTADEIRASTPEGLVVTTATDTPEGPIRQRTIFIRCGADDCDMESVTIDDAGSPVADARQGTARWVDLQAHASFPAAVTTRTADTIDHPLGRLACWRYEVGGEQGVTVFWFARDLPGMPVRFGRLVDGELAGATDLVAREAPGGGP